MLSYKNRYRIDLIKKAAPLASSPDASAAESLESCSRPDLDDYQAPQATGLTRG